MEIETVMLGSLECALGAKDGVVDAGFKEKLRVVHTSHSFLPKDQFEHSYGLSTCRKRH
jgi:hypothetical protein